MLINVNAVKLKYINFLKRSNLMIASTIFYIGNHKIQDVSMFSKD